MDNALANDYTECKAKLGQFRDKLEIIRRSL